MKKSYVVPKSRLYALKMKENIADSVTQGDDVVNDFLIIMFTQNTDPCRGLYTGVESAPNTLGTNATFGEYFDELSAYGGAMLWHCIKR